MALAQKQTHRSVEQNKKLTNNPNIHRQLIYDKVGKNEQWRKHRLFHKRWWENCTATHKRMRLKHFITSSRCPSPVGRHRLWACVLSPGLATRAALGLEPDGAAGRPRQALQLPAPPCRRPEASSPWPPGAARPYQAHGWSLNAQQ